MYRKRFFSLQKFLVWFWMVALLIVGCSAFSTTTGLLSPFLKDGNIHNGGKWSPDGRWFATSVFGRNILQILSSKGEVISTISGCDLSGDGRDYTWLPDDRISCFWGNEPPNLKVITLDKQGKPRDHILLPIPIMSGTGIYDIEWNPHTFWLATISEAQPGTGAGSLLLTLSDQAGKALMTPLPVTAQLVSWSPDGTILALMQQNGALALWHMQHIADGKLTMKLLRQLPAGNPADESVTWSRDSRWLVARHRSDQGEDYLFLLAVDGTERQIKLTSSTTDGQLAFPAWSPDGKQLIVMRVVDGALLSLNIAEMLKEQGVEA
jgi:WD40 repeat protein